MSTRRINMEEVMESRFYQLPKWLVHDEQFKGLSNDAKMLYCLMRDRLNLSLMNKLMDKNGDAFIFYTRSHMGEDLQMSDKTVTKVVKELVKYNLIDEVRQGCNKANRIYVKTVCVDSQWTRKSDVSKNVDVTNHNTETLRPKDTETKDTKTNDTESSSSKEATTATELDKCYFDCFEKKPVPKIKRDIESFRNTLSDECIKLAFERSAGNSWAYCLKILNDWVSKGIKTLADVELKDTKPNTTPKQQNAPQQGLRSKNEQFTTTYSHNWDLDHLDELAQEYLERNVYGNKE